MAMTPSERQELRERCLDRALQYHKSYANGNEVDLMRTARHFYEYITTGSEKINDND